jgi:hypothetical protein
MRKFTLIVIAVAFVATSAFGAGVVGTKHDLSGTLTTGTQVCVFCHTPHSANGDAVLADKAPLWNQDLNDAANDYGSYTSDTFDATDIAAVTRATYSSTLLCLSCHDGTVAPGSFYNAPNPEPNASSAIALTGNSSVGLTISDDHPVNFTYATSIAAGDTGLVDPGPVAFLDSAGKLQCSSCHDPHDQATTPDPNVDFMNDTLEGSALCLNCHIK